MVMGTRRLHESRAGARVAGRQAHRRVGVRLRSLRNAGRPSRVRGRDDDGCARRRAAARAGSQHAAAATPINLRRLIERCLVKDAKLRLRDIGEARIALSVADGSAPDTVGPLSPSTNAPRRRVVATAAVAALVTSVMAFAPRVWVPSRGTGPRRITGRDVLDCSALRKFRARAPEHVHRVLARRVDAGPRQRRGRRGPNLAAVGVESRGKATGGHRRRVVAVLVARWPLDRVLRRRPAQARGRAGRRAGEDLRGEGLRPSHRHVGERRHDPLRIERRLDDLQGDPRRVDRPKNSSRAIARRARRARTGRCTSRTANSSSS